jgi:wobble nucleotide-excising tRNase
MKTNFMGSAPQSEFVIGLRQQSVPLKSPNGPDFDSALSEGDKRTLAFAFFAAQLLDDPQIANLIVMIDDPMSSMDANRRATTISTIVDLQR